MTRSLRAAARMFAGDALTFAEKLTELVGVPAEPVPDETIAVLHGRLGALMTQRGFTGGTLAQRVAAWQEGRYLDPDVIPAAFDRLMARASALHSTASGFSHSTGMPAPAACSVQCAWSELGSASSRGRRSRSTASSRRLPAAKAASAGLMDGL